jgi:hypothetical protein
LLALSKGGPWKHPRRRGKGTASGAGFVYSYRFVDLPNNLYYTRQAVVYSYSYVILSVSILSWVFVQFLKWTSCWSKPQIMLPINRKRPFSLHCKASRFVSTALRLYQAPRFWMTLCIPACRHKSRFCFPSASECLVSQTASTSVHAALCSSVCLH